MISSELAVIHATCHTSDWRGLSDGSPHPVRYVFLSYDEIDELLATGAFTLPEDLVPESVRKWRSLTDAIAEVNRLEELEDA